MRPCVIPSTEIIGASEIARWPKLRKEKDGNRNHGCFFGPLPPDVQGKPEDYSEESR